MIVIKYRVALLKTRQIRAGYAQPKAKIYEITKSRAEIACSMDTQTFKKGGYANRVGETAAVYLAGVLEYFLEEMLDLSGNQAKPESK